MIGKLTAYAATISFTSATVTAGLTECPYEVYNLIVPPGLQEFDQYGAAIASSGDWLFVSAPMDDQMESDAGAVYVFTLSGKDWTFHQKLVATGGVGPAHFGFSIAAQGELLIVGAENDREITQGNPSAWGAAYLFQLENNQWVQQHKVFGFGAGDARQFGYSAAIGNDVVVIGARIIANDTTPGKGAAFVFRNIANVLVSEQRLTADVPEAFDLFGTAVGADAGRIVVGASGNDVMATNAGAAFVFSHNGTSWIQQAALHSSTPAVNDHFGERVDLEGDTTVISAAFPDSSGVVFVFRRTDGGWSAAQQLVAPDGVAGDRFGSALDLHEGILVVGASNRDLTTNEQAGAGYIFRLVEDSWVAERRLELLTAEDVWFMDVFYPCYGSGPDPFDWHPITDLDFNRMGASVALANGAVFVSSSFPRPLCWGEGSPENAGALYRFDVSTPLSECMIAVGFDNCAGQPDCNGNMSPDACDVDGGFSADCNGNASPDECDQGMAYKLPNCANSLAVAHSGDYIWLNQHRVKPGGQFLNHVSFNRSGYIPQYTPVTVLVYSDPTNDGDPSDAELLASADTIVSRSYYSSSWAAVEIPLTYVGPVGSFLFIGAVIRPPFNDLGWNGPLACTGTSGLKRSWRAMAPAGQADIYSLANNATPISLHPNVRSWGVAGIGADCNGNGIWDACDIVSGELLDTDNNGIPDSCDVPPCFFADIEPLHGDGQINVLDLLQVITNWGVCEPCYAICPGDTNDDCATNVIDLLAVINGWGACP